VHLVEQASETAAVFGEIDRFGRRADDGNSVRFEVEREIERCLTAKLHNHTLWALSIHYGEDVFECERLEIKAVRSVVIGRDGFRIAIDHNGLDAALTQCISGPLRSGESQDLMASGAEPVGGDRAEVAGGAGDKDLHHVPPIAIL